MGTLLKKKEYAPLRIIKNFDVSVTDVMHSKLNCSNKTFSNTIKIANKLLYKILKLHIIVSLRMFQNVLYDASKGMISICKTK